MIRSQRERVCEPSDCIDVWTQVQLAGLAHRDSKVLLDSRDSTVNQVVLDQTGLREALVLEV